MSRANFVQVQLAAAATDIQTTLSVKAPVGGFVLPPAGGGRLVLTDSPGRPLAFEVVSYTSRTGTGPYTLNGVVRGLEGTVGLAWGIDTYVMQSLTAGELDEIITGREPAIAAGTTAQYRRGDKTWQDLATAVRAAVMTGLSTATATAVSATDSLLAAIGKLQAQITGLSTSKLDASANAVSATKLQTARTISVAGDATGSLTFDGTANVSMDVTLQPSGVTAGTHTKLTVDSKGRVTGGTSLLVSDVPVLNQNTTGNAGSATKLATARSIALAGDVTGSATFDGSANVSISATVANDSHTHDTRYPVLSAERVLTGVAAGSWVTIAQVPSQGGRAYGEFIVYDTDSGKHNVVKIIASHSYGQSVVACVGGNRYSTRTIAHVRVLYGTADRTYDGAKLQVYIENTCALRVRALMINQISGWSAWSEMTPVVEGTPAGWVEDMTTRYDDITNTATGFSGSFSGSGTLLTGLNAANLASGTIPDARLSGTYTGVSITGNAATATKLATARTISLTGDVTGSVAFDGSGNVSITATVADDSHNHTIANVDGLQNALDAKAPLASPALTGTPTAPTAAVGTSTTQVATTAFVNAEIANDAPSKTGAGASGSWGISVTGNAATATKLATARAINGVLFDGSANITVADSTKVPTGRVITAGNGLTGGGDLTANRTLTLGTPGTLTMSSTNAVTATSHTHAIDVPAATAWVNFNGTGTVAIRDSYNVSSITDRGTGIYTINFAAAMVDANYAWACGSDDSGDNLPFVNVEAGVPPTTAGLPIQTTDNSAAKRDFTRITAIIFGGK